jgi:hypothetical protein
MTPLNVWFSDGVKYVDYRRPDGRIVTRVADTAVDGYEMYGPDDRLSIGDGARSCRTRTTGRRHNMSKRWIVPVALALPLIIAGCGTSGPKVDQRSYDAGYHSGAVQMVNGGSNAVWACENLLEASAMFQPSDWQPYDTMSFNSGVLHRDP